MHSKEQAELWSKFNYLWTKAVGTPDYNKEEWKQLEAAIIKVIGNYNILVDAIKRGLP